jgi:hypothetical protein
VSWPVSQDYNEAVQDPGASFGDPELRAAEAVTNALGLPMPCSGNFADVYQPSPMSTSCGTPPQTPAGPSSVSRARSRGGRSGITRSAVT